MKCYQQNVYNLILDIFSTGGIFGTISVVVRTVGGGEPWTSQIVASSSDTNDTIAQVLGNRNSENIATGGDYEILDTMVTFLQGEVTKQVSVSILTDNIAEPDETVIVYLTQPTGGARIALGTPDGGKKVIIVMSTVKSVPLKLRRVIFFDNSSKNMALLIVIVRSICPDKSNSQLILTYKVGSLDFVSI